MTILLPEIKLASELEKRGHDFYLKAAKQSDNPLAANTLGGLAERELAHLKRLEEIYLDLSGKRAWSSELLENFPFPSRADLLKPILSRLKISLDKKFSTQKDIDQLYRIAEKLEEESFELYELIAKESQDAAVKTFFLKLAGEEREHFAILEDTLLYLNDPGEWYRREERWIVEG